MAIRTPIYLEQGRTRTFALAVDWPGWARSAKNDEAAVEELLAYAERYAEVAGRAGLSVPSPPDLVVVQRVPGTATTDFGAPSEPTTSDAQELSASDLERQVHLMQAAWDVVAEAAAASSATLRKGPHGGGRDRDAVVAHVNEAERAYARKLGVRHPPYRGDADVASMRAELCGALLGGTAAGDWAPAYAIRRIAWHVLDHAWEIQDKSEHA